MCLIRLSGRWLGFDIKGAPGWLTLAWGSSHRSSTQSTFKIITQFPLLGLIKSYRAMYSITATTPLRLTATAIPKTVYVGSLCVLAGGHHYSTLPSIKARHSPLLSTNTTSRRGISSGPPKSAIKEFFPKVETKQIVETETSWQHPV